MAAKFREEFDPLEEHSSYTDHVSDLSFFANKLSLFDLSFAST